MTANHAFRFGVVANQVSSGEEWLALARRAESLGFSTFLMPDTMESGPRATMAALPALAMAAAVTDTLRLGTYVLNNNFRNPVLLARESATVDLLSGGRFELGLGAGHSNPDEYGRLGIPSYSASARVTRLADSVALIKALFDAQRVDAPDGSYPVSGADVFPQTVQRPPLLIAGAGNRLLELAGRTADIVAFGGNVTDPDTVAGFVERVRRAAESRFEELELSMNLIVAGERPDPAVAAFLGPHLDTLMRSGSLRVLSGTPQQMCDELLARREKLGITYWTVPAPLMDAIAPVIEHLSNRN
ncbi:TIGR03621 family F420-dependent LLM class oxidoreductase [Nocardia alni]|uniref:TIGR03621 family F420-dependent LLM class oxidoreductase n=1 Tax=Nocardia alni TaxID=2815723 RepID=UPI001C22DFCE|nr:TIGR03621 family F420-dependent LLM class oxidoreductase [Nocardia alni]